MNEVLRIGKGQSIGHATVRVHENLVLYRRDDCLETSIAQTGLLDNVCMDAEDTSAIAVVQDVCWPLYAWVIRYDALFDRWVMWLYDVPEEFTELNKNLLADGERVITNVSNVRTLLAEIENNPSIKFRRQTAIPLYLVDIVESAGSAIPLNYNMDYPYSLQISRITFPYLPNQLKICSDLNTEVVAVYGKSNTEPQYQIRTKRDQDGIWGNDIHEMLVFRYDYDEYYRPHDLWDDTENTQPFKLVFLKFSWYEFTDAGNQLVYENKYGVISNADDAVKFNITPDGSKTIVDNFSVRDELLGIVDAVQREYDIINSNERNRRYTDTDSRHNAYKNAYESICKMIDKYMERAREIYYGLPQMGVDYKSRLDEPVSPYVVVDNLDVRKAVIEDTKLPS